MQEEAGILLVYLSQFHLFRNRQQKCCLSVLHVFLVVTGQVSLSKSYFRYRSMSVFSRPRVPMPAVHSVYVKYANDIEGNNNFSYLLFIFQKLYFENFSHIVITFSSSFYCFLIIKSVIFSGKFYSRITYRLYSLLPSRNIYGYKSIILNIVTGNYLHIYLLETFPLH